MPSQEAGASLVATQGRAAVAAAGGPPAYQTRSLSQSSRQPSESGPPARRAATLARDKTAAAMAPIAESQDGEETTSGSEDEGGHDATDQHAGVETSPDPHLQPSHDSILARPRHAAGATQKESIDTFASPEAASRDLCRDVVLAGGVPWVTRAKTKWSVTCGMTDPKCSWAADLRKLARGKDAQGHPLPDKWLVDVINPHHDHGLEVFEPAPSTTSPSKHKLVPRAANGSKLGGHPQVVNERMPFSPSRLANQAATHRHALSPPRHHQGAEAPFYPQAQLHETPQYGYNAGSQRGGRASMLPATQSYGAHSQAPPAPATPRDAGEMSLPQQVLSSVIATNGSSEDLLEKLQTIIDLQKVNHQPSSQTSAASLSNPHGSPPRRDYDQGRLKSNHLPSCCDDLDPRGAGPSRHAESSQSSSRRRRREDYSSSDDHGSYSSQAPRRRSRGGRREREKKRRRAERERSDYWSPGRSQEDPRPAASNRDRHHHDERGRHNERSQENDVYYPEDHRRHSVRPKEERHHDSRSHHYHDDSEGRRGRRGSPYNHHGEDRRARSPSMAPRRRHHEQH